MSTTFRSFTTTFLVVAFLVHAAAAAADAKTMLRYVGLGDSSSSSSSSSYVYVTNSPDHEPGYTSVYKVDIEKGNG